MSHRFARQSSADIVGLFGGTHPFSRSETSARLHRGASWHAHPCIRSTHIPFPGDTKGPMASRTRRSGLGNPLLPLIHR